MTPPSGVPGLPTSPPFFSSGETISQARLSRPPSGPSACAVPGAAAKAARQTQSALIFVLKKSAVAPRRLAAPPATGPQHRFGVPDPPVLGVEGRGCSQLSATDIRAVDQQALLSALHIQDDLGDRDVGDRFEAGPDPGPDRIDPRR